METNKVDCIQSIKQRQQQKVDANTIGKSYNHNSFYKNNYIKQQQQQQQRKSCTIPLGVITMESPA